MYLLLDDADCWSCWCQVPCSTRTSLRWTLRPAFRCPSPGTTRTGTKSSYSLSHSGWTWMTLTPSAPRVSIIIYTHQWPLLRQHHVWVSLYTHTNDPYSVSTTCEYHYIPTNDPYCVIVRVGNTMFLRRLHVHVFTLIYLTAQCVSIPTWMTITQPPQCVSILTSMTSYNNAKCEYAHMDEHYSNSSTSYWLD